MRISSNIPSYKPSYSAATLPQPQAQETPNEPVFAGQGIKKSGTNWKKQVATLGLMTMAGLAEQANAASAPGRVNGSRTSSSDAHQPSSALDIPGVNLDIHHNMPVADPMAAAMPEVLKAQGKKAEQTKAEQKKAEAKKLEAQKEEDKKAEAKFLAQKNALTKRDGDASKVCKAPDGAVVIASWWSTTGASAHG